MSLNISLKSWDNESMLEIQKQITGLLSKGGLNNVTLDFSSIVILDSQGILLLSVLKDRVADHYKVNLKISNVNPLCTQILSKSGLESLILV